ncbi:AMP-ligase [Ahniella affigens]|uniref:Long-chain-fatty-acid--CoA ligase n=1 Tax=Ahniella affigens TaxID=2021234 RepID=A0A2P1PX37_9GAMM|nr:AMP-binding protein [Ahniella affigens]AVP99390.1 AMP-ligase [Ahniella affigens]
MHTDFLRLLTEQPRDAVFAYRDTLPITVAAFLGDVAQIRPVVRTAAAVINLCEDRYAFLVGMAAALAEGRTSLLPSSRAPDVVAEVATLWPGSMLLDDRCLERANDDVGAPTAIEIDPGMTALIGFTSGSTGQPKPNAKTVGSLMASTARNAAMLRAALPAGMGMPSIVATVPPQHMYGIELSVYLPLLAGFPVSAARPLFPADIATCLAAVSRPRILVSTPVHLRALLDSGVQLPKIDLLVSATAPLDANLAAAIEQRCGAPLLELFGSTETCVIASRQTARDEAWHRWPDVTLQPVPEGTWVNAPWFQEPKLLQDHLRLLDGLYFMLEGRQQDLVDIAGKRASLADLTQRLLKVPGVIDAAFVMPDPDASGRVPRLAALVVAPGRSAGELLQALRNGCDPVFLPRPLRLVERLPRNETGKLRRADLLELLKSQA